jgi:hypothetical protein
MSSTTAENIRLRKENEELRAKITALQELNANLLAEIDSFLRDERPDENCNYCSKMVSECGQDHGDEMRWEQRECQKNRGH